MSTTDSAGAALKPVILDGQPESFTPAPSMPGQLIMRPTSLRHAAFRGGAAGLLLVGAIVNIVFGGRFPSNAPVETILNGAITINLFAGTVLLAVFAVLALIRRSVPVLPERTSPLSIAAAILAGVATAGWIICWLLFALGPIVAGARLHYSDNVGPIVFLGVPWMLGFAFGVISLRSGGRRTARFAGLAIGFGVLLLVIAVGSAVLYGLGLTT